MIYFLIDDLLGLDGYSCSGSKIFAFFEAAKFIIRIIQIAVPFALVIWGSLDWFKALIAHDEKEMRMKRKPFVARLIAAMIILLFPWLIEIISSIVAGNSDAVNIFTCYHEATPRIDFSNMEVEIDDEDDEGIIGGFRDKSKNKNNSSSNNDTNSNNNNDSNSESNETTLNKVLNVVTDLLGDDDAPRAKIIDGVSDKIDKLRDMLKSKDN